ncbi:hypothetical protein LIER_42174 [Lithospermum erythrorhizon]|uniref:ATP-dependent DNA helicase n=1 Tax=Lithospermum erythrorhizon TaxID=34254 RepID=A0AAV3RLQ2_LITER
MRGRNDPGFIDYLMRIGNEIEPADEIEISHPMLIPYTILERSIEHLITYMYPYLNLFHHSPFKMMQRIILCPKNKFVDDMNKKLINRIPREKVVYISDDQAKHLIDQGDYVDYLNSLEPKGLLQHRLILKKIVQSFF